jgi:hypothetical protein
VPSPKKKSSANALLAENFNRLWQYGNITQRYRDHSAGYSFVDPSRERATGVLNLNIRLPPLLVGAPSSQL